MKKIELLFSLCFVVLSYGAFAQLKVTSNGYVGINNPTPSYRFDVNSGESRFSYPDRYPLHLLTSGTDPMLCSDNKIVFYRIDGTGFANIQCQVCTEHSDSTAKENIIYLKGIGLKTVEKLRGVSFNWKNDKNKRMQSGFLAQEVEKVIPEAVFTNDSTQKKSLAYSVIIPYLTEAIKEQLAQIEELKSKITSIEENCCKNNLKSQSVATGTTNDIAVNQAQLDQNIPNPFSKETKIGCYVPEGSNTSFLYIYDMNGAQLQQYSIMGKGKQAVIINGNSFAPGMYFYALVVDDKEIATKRMILTK
jgi:hypothetical protein